MNLSEFLVDGEPDCTPEEKMPDCDEELVRWATLSGLPDFRPTNYLLLRL